MVSRGLPELPIELWHIILLLACIPSQAQAEVFPIPVYKTSVAPVLLSHVCRSWRYLVINCPEFWTDISYRFEGYITYGINPNSELMKLWVERSLEMPLILDIDIWDIGHPENRSESYEFLLVLFGNRKRWTSATLHMLLEKIDDDAWEDIGAFVEDAPLLETLKITIEPEDSEFSDTFSDTLAALWNRAPQLTKLAIEFVGTDEVMGTDEDIEAPDYISDWALTNGIPYDQLTHLLLDPDVNGEITWEEVSSIFALAQNLVSCSLHGIHGYYDQPHPFNSPVVLQYLQHLDLSGPYNDSEDPDEHDTLLPLMNQTLTAPSLQTLSLLGSSDMWYKNAYADFIARSNPPLTTLHFGLSPAKSPQSLIECIRLSPPTLRSLHTNHRKAFSPEFSKRMSEWDKEAGKFKLCPVLQQLAYTPDQSSFPKGMANMLRKRLCPPDGSSRSFNKFIIPRYLQTELEADLKSLTDDPYCLRLEYVREILPEARDW